MKLNTSRAHQSSRSSVTWRKKLETRQGNKAKAVLGARGSGILICDSIQKKVEVYRREQAALKLAVTLFNQDELTSPLLPGFNCLVSKLF